eukprot:1159046-Pelagomonas_calceolata.AAC.3
MERERPKKTRAKARTKVRVKDKTRCMSHRRKSRQMRPGSNRAVCWSSAFGSSSLDMISYAQEFKVASCLKTTIRANGHVPQ